MAVDQPNRQVGDSYLEPLMQVTRPKIFNVKTTRQMFDPSAFENAPLVDNTWNPGKSIPVKSLARSDASERLIPNV